MTAELAVGCDPAGRAGSRCAGAEAAAEMRRNVLQMDLGGPDGVNVAEELARDRADER